MRKDPGEERTAAACALRYAGVDVGVDGRVWPTYLSRPSGCV